FFVHLSPSSVSPLFLFTDPAPTAIYTLSLHDALPICGVDDRGPGGRLETLPHPHDASLPDQQVGVLQTALLALRPDGRVAHQQVDRKSTRLNSSHVKISYAVFCLKKKNSRKTSDETDT